MTLLLALNIALWGYLPMYVYSSDDLFRCKTYCLKLLGKVPCMYYTCVFPVETGYMYTPVNLSGTYKYSLHKHHKKRKVHNTCN